MSPDASEFMCNDCAQHNQISKPFFVIFVVCYGSAFVLSAYFSKDLLFSYVPQRMNTAYDWPEKQFLLEVTRKCHC